MPRGRGRVRGRYNPAYRRQPRVAQEPADVQPPEPQQLLHNPPLQLHPLIPEPDVNQHSLQQQPIQVPLGEPGNVEILDEPLLVPDYTESDIFISNGTKDKIWNFDYIDLALLHKANINNQQDQQSVISVDNGRLVLQSKKIKRANIIDSIEAWTDAFIVYEQMFSCQT